MQLEEMRASKRSGEDDPQLRKDLEGAKANFEGMLAKSQVDLEALWERWDAAFDAAELCAEPGTGCERGSGVSVRWMK